MVTGPRALCCAKWRHNLVLCAGLGLRLGHVQLKLIGLLRQLDRFHPVLGLGLGDELLGLDHLHD